MRVSSFIKENFALLAGLLLPVLLILGFMVSVMLPKAVVDPPKYDLVFSVRDYRTNVAAPFNTKLFVKDGVLKVQYFSNPTANYAFMQNLYLFDAKTMTVRQLPLPFPEDADKIEKIREETVEATKDLKLDTTLTSPDGYQFNQNYRSYRRGLFNEIFWSSGSYNAEARLWKDGNSIPVKGADGQYYSYYNAEFVGWVIP